MLIQSESPEDFSGVIGNESVIASLQVHMSDPNRPHCYAFHGPSGTGKSLLSRICASKLGAHSFDILEYNTASTRGIDTAREIIERSAMAPMGKATVFILDEVQSSTKDFQQALLIPTQDVPSHIYFFIATTEYSKILPALKRRFTHFKLESIDKTEIFVYIASIAKKYSISVSMDVLDIIAEKAYGSIAMALNLLDKVRGIPEKDQMAILDEEDDKEVQNLASALLYGKPWGTIVDILATIDKDYETIRHMVRSYVTAVLMNKKSSKLHLRSAQIIEMFDLPFYQKPDLVVACYKLTR